MQVQCLRFSGAPHLSRNGLFDEEQWQIGCFCGHDITNPAVETLSGPESKLCACGLEVRHQQPSKRARGEDAEDGERELFEAVATEAGVRSQVKGALEAQSTLTEFESL